MKAIILAAGKGTRLYPLTLNKPKGLLELGNETILDRLIYQFKSLGIKDILVVVGYQKESLIKHFGSSVRFIYYKNFAKTNNLHTLWSIRDELNDDIIISFADLVVDKQIFDALLQSKDEITMVVDTSKVLHGTMRVSVSNERITSITSTSIKEANGNFIGLAKISKSGCKVLYDEMSNIVSSHFSDYYTIAIDNLVRRGGKVGCCDVREYIWREIDTQDDYDELVSIYDRFS